MKTTVPWDMTALDMKTHAVLFVTNLLNGTAAMEHVLHLDWGTHLTSVRKHRLK